MRTATNKTQDRFDTPALASMIDNEQEITSGAVVVAGRLAAELLVYHPDCQDVADAITRGAVAANAAPELVRQYLEALGCSVLAADWTQ
jgi:hypothetical protein